MSDKELPPTREQLESITYNELVSHLSRKKVAVKCKECPSIQVAINVCGPERDELSITQDTVTSNKHSSTAYQYFSVACITCGHTRFFNAIIAYRSVLEERALKNDA